MDGLADLDPWTLADMYPNFYPPMTSGEDVGSGDSRYDMQYPSLTMGPADVVGLVHPTPTDFPHHPAHISDPESYVQNVTYIFSPSHISTSRRPQVNSRLWIDTQPSPYRIEDATSSTTSISSFPAVLQTPYGLYPERQPSIYNSPQSGLVDGRMLMPDPEKLSPLPVSPLSPFSPSFETDIVFGEPSSPLPSDIDVVTQVQMPHIVEWKRVNEHCGTSGFIPQTVYQPYTEADRKRYIRDVKLRETIFFELEDSSELGISLDDALKQRLRRLKDKADLMFVGCGPSVSIRIQWPGYAQWSKQIPTTDFRTPKGNITRAKLAKNIATCVRRFAEKVQDKPMEAESDISWKIGKRHIKVEDLILVSLHHVSKGSWQPQLRLRPSASIAAISYPWDESFPSISRL